MTDTIYVLVAVTGCESEPAAVAAIENLSNDEQCFDVEETVIDDGEGSNEMGAVIYFP